MARSSSVLATFTGFSSRRSADSRMNAEGVIPKCEERATMAARSLGDILTLICAVFGWPRIALAPRGERGMLAVEREVNGIERTVAVLEGGKHDGLAARRVELELSGIPVLGEV